MSDAHDPYGTSIPLLDDVLVPGNLFHARDAQPAADAAGVAAGGAAATQQSGDPFDADAIAERLRGRCVAYLSGEGRAVIEARCRAALQEHSNWLVGRIAQEVGLALETELTGWVKAAVRDELAARTGRAPSADA